MGDTEQEGGGGWMSMTPSMTGPPANQRKINQLRSAPAEGPVAAHDGGGGGALLHVLLRDGRRARVGDDEEAPLGHDGLEPRRLQRLHQQLSVVVCGCVRCVCMWWVEGWGQQKTASEME